MLHIRYAIHITYRVIKKIGPVLTNVYCTLIFHKIIIDQYKILYTCPIFV